MCNIRHLSIGYRREGKIGRKYNKNPCEAHIRL
jgi:hypothetical protein